MSMICPRCQVAYQQRLQCPKCGQRLEYQVGSRGLKAETPGERRPTWQETPWGRIAVGLLIAQGLYHGLRHLGNAGMLAADPQLADAFWNSPTGLVVVQVLQALGLLLGGALAGAGRQRGIMFGALVGVWNGLIFIIIHSSQQQLLSPMTLYGQPLLQTAFGALGGLVGQLIWKPLPVVAPPGPLSNARPSGSTKVPLSRMFGGRIHWIRVLLGTGVVVAGALSATAILDFVVAAGHEKFDFVVETHFQAHLITWEITALAVVIGSALAGAGTRNGLKQGLVVGILSAVVLVGLEFGKPTFDIFHLTLTLSTALFLSVAGGWFGGSLFPVLAPPERHERTPVPA